MQVLRKLLFPISLVYGLIVFLRNRLYDSGVFSSKSYQIKTICVGNLSVGGTGKTPMIELLVKSLQDKYRVAILSRGYKRKSNGFILATTETSVENLGDEPFQLKTKFPDITVAVDANRRNGITQLEKLNQPEVILLDDAFQHRKVTPGFSLLLTSYDNLYVDDWYLPTGNLRDAKAESKRADVIIVTKCPETLVIEERDKIIVRLKPKEHQKVLFSYLTYNRHLQGNERSLASLKNKEVTLVTGIANPLPLIAFLKDEGISFNHMKFDDHHFFTKKELAVLRDKQCVLTTEKDYARLKNELSHLHYIEVSHRFFNTDDKLFIDAVEGFMKANF